LQSQNVHNFNPAIYKRVNDLALKSNFSGKMTLNEMVSFFFADDLLKKGSTPSILDMLTVRNSNLTISKIFEVLDEDRTGMLEASNVRHFLELS
jgi:hypothetical protein